MSQFRDGPASTLFAPIGLKGNTVLEQLAVCGVSVEMSHAIGHAPNGTGVAWGIPFDVGNVICVIDKPVHIEIGSVNTAWLVFMHTSDIRTMSPGPGGFLSPTRWPGQLAEHAADYVMVFADGSEERVAICRRHQVGAFSRKWGENCFEAVAFRKPRPLRASHEQPREFWGTSQTRVDQPDSAPWLNWLWAWQNPHPGTAITAIRFEPVCGAIVVSAISAGHVSINPLRWLTRRKAVLSLPANDTFKPHMDDNGLLEQIQLDLGQVISAAPKLVYPDAAWADTYNNRVPDMSPTEVLVEYTAHPDARFHLGNGDTIPVSEVEEAGAMSGHVSVTRVPPATQRVTLRIVERGSTKPVAVKLHVHGQAGEYLAPVDRHRIINPYWFEDYSVDFYHQMRHPCAYIPGETTLDLPSGPVYIEVSKGFEIRPLRKILHVAPDTREITIELDKVLPWREKGWVTADTHVHFLSPMSAMLEGAAEGVNVVNLLASQWGELMTNVGDFDGRTTWGSREAGGDGEYLVRVGTENRQHVMGHISLLGYQGRIIAPMTTGGPDESALGDPVEILLTEWARQCKRQGGIVVLPHFPHPKAEHAAAIVSGDVDGVEMTSWGDLYKGIDPYSLADWYHYLNCGYQIAAVAGTDKMTAMTAVGTVRTYARVPSDTPFTYQAWMDAVRRAETFVSYGPLIEFSVDGKPMGGTIQMPASGGTVDVAWEVASVTVPMSRVELIVNGAIRESLAVDPAHASGHWSVKIEDSAWLALLVRGHYADQPEIIAAHSSPVMVKIENSPILAAADAVTILEQIEGALAYLDTIGTRADDAAYKRMRLVLTSAHRQLHNRMHQHGFGHLHSPVTDHEQHHK